MAVDAEGCYHTIIVNTNRFDQHKRGTIGDQPIQVLHSAFFAPAQIKKRNVPGTAHRVGIRGGGCSGFSYVIEFHDGEPRARDTVYDLKASDGSDVHAQSA